MEDEAAAPVTVTTPDHFAAELLAAALASPPAEIFSAGTGFASDEATRFGLAKQGADLIVKARLGRFADEGRTTLELTNAGRYWAMHGGWMTFLKEPAVDSGGGRGRNPETEALRSEFMKLRLRTFWWTFGLSVAGFILSIVSMTVAVMYGNRFFN